MNPTRASYKLTRRFSETCKIAIVRVTAKRIDYYMIRRIDAEPPHVGFACLKLTAIKPYHVKLTGPKIGTCECWQFLKFGYCRHVFAAIAAHSGEDSER